MNEYYSVVRTKDYLSHEAGSPQVYKNHKYIARARTRTGEYRYFYDTAELAAYKSLGGQSGSTQSGQHSRPNEPPLPARRQAAFGNSHLSSGALNYRGESDSTTVGSSIISNAASRRKKKKNKSKKSVTRVIESIVRR